MELNKIEELELANMVSTQDVDRYKRECLSLRETVSRLEADRTTLRARELRDQETINTLLEEIEKKQREFTEMTKQFIGKYKDAECGRKIAEAEAREWKTKYEVEEAVTLRLCEENQCLQEKLRGMKRAEDGDHDWKKKKFTDEVDGEMPKRAAEERVDNVKAKEQAKSGTESVLKIPKREAQTDGKFNVNLVATQEVVENVKSGGKVATRVELKSSKGEVNLNSSMKSRNIIVIDDDCDDEEDKIPLLSRLNNKRTREDDKKDSGSFGCSEPSKKCFVQKQAIEVGSDGAEKEISADLEGERISTGLANKKQRVCKLISTLLLINS